MILVITEQSKNQLKRSSIELLSWAKKTGLPVATLAYGQNAKSLAAEVASYGSAKHFCFSDASFDQYESGLFSASTSQLIQELNPTLILASASSFSRDLFPRVAQKISAGLASDCTEISFHNGQVKATKPLFAGKCFADVNFAQPQKQIVLMRANQLPVDGPVQGAAPAEIIEKTAASNDLKSLIKEIVKGASEKLDLTEANIIVSGGRGLKEAANFKLVEELAQVLGATVGASRAVVDAGWVSHSMQVGQTGKTVAPTLYIAVGISGAIQHLAGMSGSKVIVAINNDSNAPIFQKATYGLVGDLFEIVPLLRDEFKKVLHG